MTMGSERERKALDGVTLIHQQLSVLPLLWICSRKVELVPLSVSVFLVHFRSIFQ